MSTHTAPAAAAARFAAYDNSTNKQPPQSRDVVLAAAHVLICRHGFAGLSMRELARESGFAKATIYHHFQDKGDVIRSVVTRDLGFLQEKIAEAASGPGSVEQRLRHIIATYLGLQVERGMIVLQLLRESSMLEADLYDILRRYRHEMAMPVIAVLQEAVAMGKVRAVNVDHAVTSLFGMIHSFVTYNILFDDVVIDETVIDHIYDLFINGVMVKADAQPTSQPTSQPTPTSPSSSSQDAPSTRVAKPAQD